MRVVGSLLLGRYDDDGLLHHCGFPSTFKANERAAVLDTLQPRIGGEGFSGSAPGGPSRWSTARGVGAARADTGLRGPLRPLERRSLPPRHNVLRWRPDKAPRTATFDQVRPRRWRSA